MTGDMQPPQFLDEIRQVFARGEREYGLDLVNAYLEDNPGNVEAELLKADLCLQLDREPAFVGDCLNRWRHIPALSAPLEPLQAQADTLVRAKLAEGRRKLQGRYLKEALDRFQAAVALAPWDPAVPLAVGLALFQVRERFDSEDTSPIGSSAAFRDLDKLPGSPLELIEQYLRLSVERSTPDQPAHGVAIRHLVKHWLTQGEPVKALELLEKAEHSSLTPPAVPPQNFLEEAAEVAQAALTAVLRIVADLLRMGQDDLASRLLDSCAEVAPDLLLLHLLKAERCRQADQPEQAAAEYRQALECARTSPAVPPLERVRALLNQASRVEPLCPFCGKTAEVMVFTCPFCGMPLEHQALALNLHEIESVSEGAADLVQAHLGLAEMLAEAGQLAEAVRHLDAAFAAVPDAGKIPPALKQRRRQWSEALERPEQPDQRGASSEETLARNALHAWEQAGLSEDTLSRLKLACETPSPGWLQVPVRTRAALTRQLIAAGYLPIAQDVLNAAFSDRAKSKTVRGLKARLIAAVDSRIAGHLDLARQALDRGQPDQALWLAETVQTLALDQSDQPVHPAHDAARLIKGLALLRLGQSLPALADFRAIIAEAHDPALVRAARLGAARALESQRDFAGGLAMLDSDPVGGEGGLADAEPVRARLGRRQRGEPALYVQPGTELVMHDTLILEAGMSHWHAVFAVALRAVSRPWNHAPQEWHDQILTAGFEFVQVLGGLRHVAGDPVFALRLISRPHPSIPERGRLSIAFLVRVTASEREMCQSLALNLWHMLRDILPCAHEYVYSFEPVVDEDELGSLLVPFEAADIAEIVHREEVRHDEAVSYTTYPFTPGSVDLNNLCWTLLRQPAPAMLSLHLLATDLMPWEMAVMDGLVVDGQAAITEQVAEGETEQDPISRWWQDAPRWWQAQVSRYVADSLRSRAFVLRISVAGAEASHPLLPEMAAAAMFGPVQQTGGGYELIHAGTPDEVATARRNLAMVDVESWVYSAAPDGVNRLRHLVSEREAALAFRLPIPGVGGIPGVPLIEARPVAPPARLPERGTVLGESVARIGGLPLCITQANPDRHRHTYVVGKTGTGKSTLLQNLALQDIDAGHGLCLIDPHGDLVEEVLARIPAHRAGDVILFDPSDEERPIGLNLLDAHSESEKHRVVTEFIGLLVRMYDPMQQGIVGPRFQHNVRNVMLTVMSVEGSTLIEVVRALTDSQYVHTLLPQVKDPLVRNYWEKQIANTSDFHKSEILDYIVSKFSRFVGDRLIRNIVGQRQTTLDFRQIMDNRQILLVNLAKGKIGPESAQFLGLLLVQSLLLSAFSRADVRPDQRPDFFLYVDEFQNFATDLFATVLSEGRKYGIAACVANQYLTQLDTDIRAAIFGNVGSIVSFRLGTQDAVILAPEMYPVFGPDDLLNLPKYTACVKLLVDGIAARPFTMRTVFDTRPVNPQRAEAIRQASRRRYGREASGVTEDVLARFAV